MEKTLWALSKEKERVSLDLVYNAILVLAQRNRLEAKNQRKDDEAQVTYGGLCTEIANQLYEVAAALENTEEINPTK